MKKKKKKMCLYVVMNKETISPLIASSVEQVIL